MLYNKSAVKNKTCVTKKQIKLARKSPLFKLNKEFIDYIKKDIIKEKGIYYSMLKLSDWLRENISYDYNHSFNGIRTASQVIRHKKGHCIEQGILFYAITRKLGIPVKPLIVKNPKGYAGSENMENLGVHVLLLFEKENNKKYLADFLSIKKFQKNGLCIAKKKMSQREFTAFCFQDAGEDFIIHEDYDNAFLAFNAAASIDPDNYTIYISAADGESYKGDLKKARKLYKHAIAIAPDITDTHWAYADFLFRTSKPSESVKNAYITSAEKNTKDIQILSDLEQKLYYFNEKELSESVKKRRLKIQNSRELKSYFN